MVAPIALHHGNIMKTLAKEFYARFAGLQRAHGLFTITLKTKKKTEGQANTKREPPTVELWVEHLEGNQGLGIIPIRDDGTCVFGALDIDNYGVDLSELEAKVTELGLPLILCRTKSGGAHLYLFTSEPIPCDIVRTKLMNWAIALGYSGTEIFPKQSRLASERDVGSWINMPYFGDDRWAMCGAEYMHPEDFLLLAEEASVDAATLESTDPPSNEDDDLLKDAPPCLRSLSRTGFPEGSRNQGLFSVGVYLRKRFGDDYGEQLDDYNQHFMDPPLGHKEVSTVSRSVGHKKYEYKCNEDPIAAACNRQICNACKYGIGTGDGDPGVTFGPLIKVLTSPPTWIWDVDGARIELTTAEMKDQGRFHTRCIDELNKWPIPVKAKQWMGVIRTALQGVQVEEAPLDATLEGTVMAYLHDYCATKAMARSREELLIKRPWQDDGKIYFHCPDFKRYLDHQRVRVTEKKLWNILREHDAGHKDLYIKGTHINVWFVPEFPLQDEAFAIPEDKAVEVM